MTFYANFVIMDNDAPLKSGLLGLQVTGYEQCDYSSFAQFARSSDLRLLGLEWTLEMILSTCDRVSFGGGSFDWRWHMSLRCSDVDHSSSQVVYPARLRLRLILPNGQVITDVQDPVKLRFHGTSYLLFFRGGDQEHPEFEQFIGPPNQPLLQSFMLLAQIDVMGQPTVLKPTVYEHSAKFFHLNVLRRSPIDQLVLTLAGFRRAHKRLIVWRTNYERKDGEDESTISCSSLHPLIPRSIRTLCNTTRTRSIGNARVSAAAALSTEGRLSAYIANDYDDDLEPDHPLNGDHPKTCDLFVLDLVTGELIHRRYDIPENTASGIRGLAHTQRGWVAWSTRWFWRLAERMEVLVGLEATHCATLATQRYLYSYMDNEGQRKLVRWDLSQDNPTRKSFHASSSSFESRKFVVNDEESLFTVQSDSRTLCLSRVILEAGRCVLEPTGIYAHVRYQSIIVDGPRVILVDEILDRTTTVGFHWTTRVNWRTTPAAKELALLALQKNKGTMWRFPQLCSTIQTSVGSHPRPIDSIPNADSFQPGANGAIKEAGPFVSEYESNPLATQTSVQRLFERYPHPSGAQMESLNLQMSRLSIPAVVCPVPTSVPYVTQPYMMPSPNFPQEIITSYYPPMNGYDGYGYGWSGAPAAMGPEMPPTSQSAQDVYWHYNPGPELYSRKVFVGGLPIDIDEGGAHRGFPVAPNLKFSDELNATFSRFGPLLVDWPHKHENKSYYPPKGYVFLIFDHEPSVQALVSACYEENDKLYMCVSSPTMKEKPVQVRPWRLADADFVVDASMALDPRKSVFVGGVPRPLKAVEMAHIFDRLYGGVCYAGIDADPELKYPKGAGRISFNSQQSYIAAISARFVQLTHGDVDKRVEVKPYVLDDQMCDECQGQRCGLKYAPFFCASVACLQYYCENCWALIHSRHGREYHKPLVKENLDVASGGQRRNRQHWTHAGK